MKKAILLLATMLGLFMNLASAQDKTLKDYDMSKPADFNEAVFRFAPIAFEYESIDERQSFYEAFLGPDSNKVYSTARLIVKRILIGKEYIAVGDTIALTMHGGCITLPRKDPETGEWTLWDINCTGHFHCGLQLRGIAFCEVNTTMPSLYPKAKANLSFFNKNYFISALTRWWNYEPFYPTVSGMGDLRYKESDFYDILKKYNRFDIPAIKEDTTPCPDDTTPPLIEHSVAPIKQPIKKSKHKTKRGKRYSQVYPTLNMRLGNATVTGNLDRYLEFDVLVKTDMTATIGSHIFYLKFDAGIFGTFNNVSVQDTNSFKLSIPTANQGKLMIGVQSGPIGGVQTDTFAITVSRVGMQVTNITTTEQVLVHARLKIQNCGSVSGLKFVKQTQTRAQTQFIVPQNMYANFTDIVFTQPTFRLPAPSALYLCPPISCTITPTTVRAGVDEWVTLTPSSGNIGTVKKKVYFEDADFGGGDNTILADSVIWDIANNKIKARVPAAKKLTAGTGYVTVSGTDTESAYKSDTKITVEYALIEQKFNIAGYKRLYLANRGCAQGLRFALDPNFKLLGADTTLARQMIVNCLNVWKARLNADNPGLNLNWQLETTPKAAGTTDGYCVIKVGAVGASQIMYTERSQIASYINGQQAYHLNKQTIFIDVNKIAQYAYLPVGTDVPAGKYDFYTAMLHEIGHALGLNHIIAPGQNNLELMYYKDYPNTAIIPAANRPSFTTGTQGSIKGANRQVADSRALVWDGASPAGSLLNTTTLGAQVPTAAGAISVNTANATIAPGAQSTFTVATNSGSVQGLRYRWQFYNYSAAVYAYCNGTSTSAITTAEIKSLFKNPTNPTLTIVNACNKHLGLKDTFSIRCEVFDGCTTKFSSPVVVNAKPVYTKKASVQLPKCSTPQALDAVFSPPPTAATLQCVAACTHGTLSGINYTPFTPAVAGTDTIKYTLGGCTVKAALTVPACFTGSGGNHRGAFACSPFSIIAYDNAICMAYPSQNYATTVSFSIGDICPPAIATYRAEITATNWATPITIGQTNSPISDINGSIPANIGLGFYNMRVAIYDNTNTLVTTTAPVTMEIRQATALQYCTFTGISGISIKNRIANNKKTIDKEEVSIYPNPSTGIFTVALPDTDGEATTNIIEVLDINGRLLLTANTTPPQTELNLSNYATGIYLVRVHWYGEVTTHKVVISE